MCGELQNYSMQKNQVLQPVISYKISTAFENYIDGNFEDKDEFSKEGIVNIIDNQLAILGKNISNTYDKLENEKED